MEGPVHTQSTNTTHPAYSAHSLATCSYNPYSTAKCNTEMKHVATYIIGELGTCSQVYPLPSLSLSLSLQNISITNPHLHSLGYSILHTNRFIQCTYTCTCMTPLKSVTRLHLHFINVQEVEHGCTYWRPLSVLKKKIKMHNMFA